MKLFSSNNKKYIGLELGKRFVRLIVLDDAEEGLVPVVHSEVAILGKDNRWSEIREALSILKERYPIEKAHVVIPEEDGFILHEKCNSFEDVQSAIYKKLPHSPQELEFDVIHQGEYSTIIAIRKTIFAEYVKILSEFNIVPLSIQTEGQAITRTASNYDDQGSCVCLYISNEETVLTIFREQVPYLSKTIKHEYIEEFSKKNKEALQWLKSVSRSIFHVYEREGMRQHDIKKEIFIGGDTSRAKIDDANFLLDSAVGNALIKPLPIWQHCFNLDSYIPTIFAEDSLRYVNVVGGALTELNKN